MDQGVMKTKLIPRNLPDPVIFQEYVRSLGISAHSHVIVYDRDDGASVSTTTGGRSCYTFKLYGHVKVSLLSGGLVHWEAEGYTTEVGPTPSPMAGDFVVNFRKEMVVKFDEMCEIEAAGNIQIVDTRRPIHFSGEIPEPSIISQVVLTDGKFPLPKETEMVRGHMKNALNLYFKDFYDDEDQVSLKSIDALRKTFDDAGVDLNCPAITTCYIGHTAALCYVVAYFCGQHNYRVYYGSWTEYGQRTV